MSLKKIKFNFDNKMNKILEDYLKLKNKENLSEEDINKMIILRKKFVEEFRKKNKENISQYKKFKQE